MSSAASAPCLLAFDTSTEVLAVAVQAGDHTAAANAAGGALASSTLLPQVHALLAQCAVTLAQVQAVAFGMGPGAFTGLRTACAVAQGLGFGLRRPLLPIDSLMIVAEDARMQLDPDAQTCEVQVAMDARMDEVYAARYLWQDQRWHTVAAPALYTLPAFVHLVSGAPAGAAAGSALGAFGTRLPWPAATHLLVNERDRAAALMRLAVNAWAAGQGVDAALALPLYLRDKVAHTTAEREAARVSAHVA